MLGVTRAGKRGVVGAFALTLTLAGCGSSAHTSSAPPAPSPSATSTPSTAAPTTVAAPTTTVDKGKPYDPTKPIDLRGTPGVTTAEKLRAETLLRRTIVDLRKFETPQEAYAAGYRSIGDRLTGDEHYIKWSDVDDGHILDPTRPESLVYEDRNGTQQVVAAMYMLPFGSRFTDAPDVGGPLTQWHIHADLCLSGNAEQKTLSGGTSVNGQCPAGSTKAGAMPMLHVWVVPNQCGPFAALEGVGAGQIAPGQTRLCDTLHGEPATN
jgi:hypothetical protein